MSAQASPPQFQLLDHPCSESECSGRSVPVTGDCRYCRQHLCVLHVTLLGGHDCVGMTDWRPRQEILTKSITADLSKLQAILQQIDFTSIVKQLRPGHELLDPILFDPENKTLRGTINVHLPVNFDDGQRWLVRAKQVGYAVPRHISREVIRSEIATLGFLREIGVPVPEVMSELYTEGGTDFYFMTRMPGSPGQRPISHKTDREKVNRTVADFARILILISNHPFDKLGGLVPGPTKGTWAVGPLVSGPYNLSTPPHHAGPFNTAAEKWICKLDCMIHAIQNRGTYGDQQEEAFLTFSWARNAIAAYEPFNRVEPTYLMHVDSIGDHLMLDADGGINGIIDWDMASTASRYEAFAAPYGFMNFASVMTTENNDLSHEEGELIANLDKLGRPDLSECVRGGKAWQRTALFVGQAGWWTRYSMVRGLAVALGVQVPGEKVEFLEEQRRFHAIDSPSLISNLRAPSSSYTIAR